MQQFYGAQIAIVYAYFFKPTKKLENLNILDEMNGFRVHRGEFLLKGSIRIF